MDDVTMQAVGADAASVTVETEKMMGMGHNAAVAAVHDGRRLRRLRALERAETARTVVAEAEVRARRSRRLRYRLLMCCLLEQLRRKFHRKEDDVVGWKPFARAELGMSDGTAKRHVWVGEWLAANHAAWFDAAVQAADALVDALPEGGGEPALGSEPVEHALAVVDRLPSGCPIGLDMPGAWSWFVRRSKDAEAARARKRKQRLDKAMSNLAGADAQEAAGAQPAEKAPAFALDGGYAQAAPSHTEKAKTPEKAAEAPTAPDPAPGPAAGDGGGGVHKSKSEPPPAPAAAAPAQAPEPAPDWPTHRIVVHAEGGHEDMATPECCETLENGLNQLFDEFVAGMRNAGMPSGCRPVAGGLVYLRFETGEE